jgi:tetratricopeptide (TPR) repeat protein
MHNWDSLAALGNYLGMADAGRLADGTTGGVLADRMLASINSSASFLFANLPPGAASDLPELLASTDFASLALQEGDRLELLADDLYKRLALPPYSHIDLPSPDIFDTQARKYLERLAVSLRAALYGAGIRKEIVSLENPAARESVEEIRRLPCRAYGGMISPGNAGRFSASLAQYVQSLLDPPGICIEPAGRTAILDILDRLSAHPDFYRLVDRERKAETARTLVSAITALRKEGCNNPEKADLLAALGILLFNVYPSPALVKFLAVHPPQGPNRFLRYEHNALMALNLLLMGKRAAAAGYCQRAYDAAPEDDLKAYAQALEGCIALEGRNYRNAAIALEKALETADRRSLRSLTGFYLGIVRYEAGDTGLALNCFRDARISAEDETDAMAASNNLGICQMALGDLAGALKSFEEVTTPDTYSGRASMKLNRSVAAGNAGIVYLSMHEHALAREQFIIALRASRDTGDARRVADQLMNIGLTHKGTGDHAAAVTHFVAALNYAYTIDYLEGVLYARDQISQALALQGKHDEEEGIYQDIARRHPGIRNLLTRR